MMTYDVSSAQTAKIELAKRELARRNIIDFVTYHDRLYVVDPVHEYIASELDDVIAGNTKRLMIFAPPQHGKSRLTSVELSAKWVGDRPNDPVLLSSYGASLAHTQSRQARDIVESESFRAIYGDLSSYEPRMTRKDSRAAHEWRLSPPHRGGMLAVGVGGPITGHGGMLGIIDDPFENWEQAQSLTYRDKVWAWYRNTFRTRIWEGGAIVLIMTRWHQDDLGGRLLELQGDKWRVVRLPALAESQDVRDKNNKYLGLPIGEPDPLGRKENEPLSPARFSQASLEEIKEDVGSQGWAAEYQGVPRPLEGSRFKRHWFSNRVDVAPEKAMRVRYWDKAGTKDGGAYTAGVLVARHEGLTYIEDVKRGQWSSLEREKVILQTAEDDAQRYGNKFAVTYYVEQEPGSGGKESAENTIRNLSGFSVYADRPTGDKDTRLEPFAAQAEAENVILVRGEWNGEWIEEIVSIPNATYRDQSDATSGAFNKMLDAQPSVHKKQSKINYNRRNPARRMP